MSTQLENFHKSFVELMNHDADLALSTITSVFLSFTLEYVKRRGEDATKQITFGWKEQRKIIIEAERDEIIEAKLKETIE